MDVRREVNSGTRSYLNSKTCKQQSEYNILNNITVYFQCTKHSCRLMQQKVQIAECLLRMAGFCFLCPSLAVETCGILALTGHCAATQSLEAPQRQCCRWLVLVQCV